eukprot:c9648_g1_i1.p1 GENE.c9648_g1_i1~~c9648_g1_i1.p1  ORF type:complete len:115 (-),score=14.84 c9648_g1_i1:58-402(-)
MFLLHEKNTEAGNFVALPLDKLGAISSQVLNLIKASSDCDVWERRRPINWRASALRRAGPKPSAAQFQYHVADTSLRLAILSRATSGRIPLQQFPIDLIDLHTSWSPQQVLKPS